MTSSLIRNRKGKVTVFPIPEEAHSPLGASSCDRWYNCAGSLRLAESLGAKSVSSVYSEEGSLAHHIASMILQGDNDFAHIGDTFIRCESDIKDAPIKVTEEMIDAILVYISHVYWLIDYFGVKGDAEQRVFLNEELNMFGTADYVQLVPDVVLNIVDYKHGAGVKVVAEFNKQLMYYALCILISLPEELRKAIPTGMMWIVQPRVEGEIISMFEMSTQELLDWYPTLIEHAWNTKKSDELIAGKWCKFCPVGIDKCGVTKQKALVRQHGNDKYEKLLAERRMSGKDG